MVSCVACSLGFYYVPTNSTKGYNQGYCDACDRSRCYACAEKSTFCTVCQKKLYLAPNSEPFCDQCVSPYFYDYSTNSCTSCSDNCKECYKESTNCTICSNPKFATPYCNEASTDPIVKNGPIVGWSVDTDPSLMTNNDEPLIECLSGLNRAMVAPSCTCLPGFYA